MLGRNSTDLSSSRGISDRGIPERGVVDSDQDTFFQIEETHQETDARRLRDKILLDAERRRQKESFFQLDETLQKAKKRPLRASGHGVIDRGVINSRHVDYSLKLVGARLAEEAASETELLKNLQSYLYGSMVKNEEDAELLIRSAFETFSNIHRIRDLDYIELWIFSLIEEYKQKQGKNTSTRAKEIVQQVLQKQGKDKRRRREEKARQLERRRVRDEISRRHKNDHTQVNLQLAKFDPFPYIKLKRPKEYENALDALYEYKEVEFFYPYYRKLYQAVRDSYLGLDKKGNVVLEIDKQSFLGLLTDTTAEAVLDQIKGEYIPDSTIILGEEIGILLGLAEKLHSLYTLIENERIVGRSGKEWEEKRFKRKLSFLMDVYAKELAKQDSSSSDLEWKNWLVYQYQRFEPRYDNWLHYEGLEGSLNPNTPQSRSFWPITEESSSYEQ